MRRDPEDYLHLDPLADVPEYCTVMIPQDNGKLKECRVEIKTMAYKGTGACGEEHLKIKTNDYGSQPVGVNPTGEC